jgi:hypothetical protein
MAPTPGTALSHAGNPTTSATITLGTTAANDILILTAVNGGATTALSSLTGTYSGGAWNATGLAAAMTASWGGSWWSRCTGNHSAQTVIVGTATDSISAMILPVSGCLSSASPMDTNTSATTLTANGLALSAFTTTVDETLVVYCGAWDDNIAPSAVTKNAVSMTLAQFSSTGGADSGTTGAFAGTHASALSKRLMAFALKPEVFTSLVWETRRNRERRPRNAANPGLISR